MTPPTREEIDAEIDGWLADSEESRRLRQQAMRREIDEALSHFRAELKTELESFKLQLREVLSAELKWTHRSFRQHTETTLRGACVAAATHAKLMIERLMETPSIKEE